MNMADDLPPGWEKRESKSQPGRYYYVSPAGQTQWFPPRRSNTARSFNWRCEIEIEFGPGRLGVNLKEVAQTTNIPFPMFQAEVEELPKLPGGKPGPAEIYNWSVRPERRLYPNMRLTQVDGVALAGCKYTEVVDKLKKAARPVKLKFADVSQGLLGEGETSALDSAPTSSVNPTIASTSALASAGSQSMGALTSAPPSAYSVQKQKKEEYMNLLVTSELSNEMWRLETQKVQSTFKQLTLKWNLLSGSLSGLLEAQVKAKKEIEAATAEKAKYDEMLIQLQKQESGAIVSPEVQRMNDLSGKNAELTQDIGHMSAGNKKLRRERDANQRLLDELEAQLVHGLTQQPVLHECLVGLVDETMTSKAKIAVIRQKVAAMELEMQKEEAKTRQAEMELAQLSKVYNQQTEVILESSRGGMVVPPEPRRSPLPARPPPAEEKPPTTSPPPPTYNATPSSSSSSMFMGSSRGGLFNRSNSTDFLATPPPHVIRQGHLEKFPTHFNQDGGGMLKSMRLMRGARERWCQLHASGTLVYYKKRGDPVPRGEIALTDPTLEVVCEALLYEWIRFLHSPDGTSVSNGSSKKPPKELVFTVSTTHAQNRFQAHTMEELRDWVTAILTFHSGWMSTRVRIAATVAFISRHLN
ncbi:hypothetical protein, variant 1 [Aphanomyces invadans]|uniref:WW domain-containing protein n=1 Tax=Aphanomyces invadans TaxID=157072 RepID=A0A024U038_9STRA|nr:hypothetical protein, variant 1 [Aphanomyces invadans]ETV99628.1 hypothetical protein, variant 1 [Aphanomyces invadans]|eukprot:XP_008872184.1 hypothetical protein, variant 1 [Aphanomyces invadans]